MSVQGPVGARDKDGWNAIMRSKQVLEKEDKAKQHFCSVSYHLNKGLRVLCCVLRKADCV